MIFVVFVLQDGLFNAAEETHGDAHMPVPVVVSDEGVG